VKKIGERGKVDFIDTDTSETDLAIVTKLWLPDSPTSSDAYLAVEILNALDRSEVETDLTERKGDDLVIRMKVYGRDEEQPDGRARVVHTVRQPTKKEVTKFFQNSAHASGKDGKIFTVTSLEPSGKLYAALGGTAEGYAGAIPINHMSAIVLHACLFAANSNSVEDLPPEE
jgi:hypothetical protein